MDETDVATGQGARRRPSTGARDAIDDWDDDIDPADDYDTATWVDWREPMSPGRRILVGLACLLAVLVLGAGLGYLWVQRQIDPPGGPGEPIDIEIPAGATTEDIGRQLADAGVIANASVWNYYTRFKDEGPFQAGEYTFLLDSSFQQAIAVLDQGPRPPESARITIPEGLTAAEIIARLADPATGVPGYTLDALQAAVSSGAIRSQFQPAEVTSLEGLLFPDTYEVGDDTEPAAFLQRLVSQTDAVLTELGVDAAAASLGVTPYEVVVIASLIEEEAKVPAERGKIARVIYNRLDQGIPLGIDATSRYEAELAGRSRDDIDFSSDSPYNTRRVAGLPPTPIAAPGRAALEAAINPEPGDWIYYVLKNSAGEHVFTASSSEFERAKAECERNDLGCG